MQVADLLRSDVLGILELEFDVSLVNGIKALVELCRETLGSADAGDFCLVKADIRDIRTGLAELWTVFEKRIETMAGLGAF